ncbi:MAG: LPS export ABC transporter permease LptF [Gammaproteobacteria bacterium]|nr:LPS export ABC transporter permease LptF [Gammaproteobacteria bacterium]
MPSIITRYLTIEILKNSSATVLILFIILMSNSLGRKLSDVAGGDVPYQALWPVMLSQSVSMLSILLPIGFFFGIIFAFGRLYKDHEMVVMNACGMGSLHFYKPVLIILIPIFMFTAYSSIWLNAITQTAAQEIIAIEKEALEFNQMRAGQFNQSKSGEHVFFMESVSDDRLQLNNIIFSQTNQDRMFFETAKTGRHKTDEVNGDLFLVFGPGEFHEGRPGHNDYKVVEFEKHGILIEKKTSSSRQQLRVKARPPELLWQSSRLEDRVELHWRIAIPVVLIVLAFLAVPLSYIAPRQGRYGKVGYALLVFIVYYNLMAYARVELEADSFPLALNFWWVHLLFIFFALALLLKRNRGYRFGRRITGQ